MHSLIISPEAEEDIRDLFDFFESLNTGLGSEILVTINETLDRIIDNPKSFQYINLKSDDFRRGITRKFGIVVIYRVKIEVIDILSIHDSRSDWKKYWD